MVISHDSEALEMGKFSYLAMASRRAFQSVVGLLVGFLLILGRASLASPILVHGHFTPYDARAIY